tara:strand:- start:3378 stop:3779 length:402 start_codon:yes stop_codon:yes gene_type:complete
MESKLLNSNDYVYYKKGDSIMTGGMKIDNMYLNENIPAMVRLGREHNNLMVPMGLIQLNTQYGGNKFNVDNYTPDTSNKGVVSDSLYDKLLNMAGGGDKAIAKRKSSKKNKTQNKKNKSKDKKRKTRKKKRTN